MLITYRNDCDRRAHRDHDRSEGEEKNDHAQTHQQTRLSLKPKKKKSRILVGPQAGSFLHMYAGSGRQ
jgi:hypothetical protein